MYGHKKCRYRFAASYRFVILDTANMGIIFGLAKEKRKIFALSRFSTLFYFKFIGNYWI